jgi:hypothetical protein
MTLMEIKFDNLASLVSELMLTSPTYILTNGTPDVEKDLLMHSLRVKAELPSIGVVSISSVYVSGAKEVVMLMTLDDKQVKILRNHGINVLVKKKSDTTNSEDEYFCVLTKQLIERIDSLCSLAPQ